MRQFAGRLEQKYKYLKEKFPDKYQTKDLKKKQAFSWNAPHILKSMRFLYKKPEVIYEELLSGTLEAEKDCFPSKSTSVKAKAAVVESEASPSLQMLTQEISALTMVVKSASMGTPKTKIPNPKNKVKPPSRVMGTRVAILMGIAPGKEKGQLHQLQDPSNLAKSHYSVINVGGGGHTSKECASQGGIDWRGLNGAMPPPEKEKGPETPKQN